MDIEWDAKTLILLFLIVLVVALILDTLVRKEKSVSTQAFTKLTSKSSQKREPTTTETKPKNEPGSETKQRTLPDIPEQVLVSAESRS